MKIRPQTEADRGLVDLLYRQAFIGNYEAEFVDALQDSGVTPVSLVAEDEDELVGHILFADVAVEVDERPVRSLALAQMAVHADQQGVGVGSTLIAAGLDAARALDMQAILVLGHPGYYPRFGFSAERASHLRTPFRRSDAFMALELEPGILAGSGGSVTYPHAFALGAPK